MAIFTPNGRCLSGNSQTVAAQSNKEKGEVILTDMAGNPLTQKPDMWFLTTDEKNVLTIKNQVVYELPSTGGSGIYRYTIGGALLMMAAALILYRNKSKEVLNK